MKSEQIRALPLDISLHLEAGYRLWRDGAMEAAQRQLDEALRRAEVAGHLAGQLAATQLLGNLAYDWGDLESARRRHTVALARCRAIGFTVGVASSLHNLGLVTARRGDLPKARAYLAESAQAYARLGNPEGAAAVWANLERLEEDQARNIGGGDDAP